MSAAEEVVAIVDEQNRVVGSATRREMRRRNLIHRATYILVFNRAGELFVQERTKTKDVFPGYFDVAAGGVVLAGESYEESAARELTEELGVDGVALESLFEFFYDGDGNRVWGRAFRCVSDGPFTLQPDEVADGFFLAPGAVLQRAASEPFTPDGIMVLKRYLEEDRAIG